MCKCLSCLWFGFLWKVSPWAIFYCCIIRIRFRVPSGGYATTKMGTHKRNFTQCMKKPQYQGNQNFSINLI